MRALILVSALSLLGLLVACNSQEQNPRTTSTPPKTQRPPTSQPPANSDSARRITAEELHKLWVKDEVLIVDTRLEPAFKQGHIRGAVLIPANEFPSRADELPKSKMIVTYCT